MMMDINQFDKAIRPALRGDRGYRVIQQLDGVGPTLVAVFVAQSAMGRYRA